MGKLTIVDMIENNIPIDEVYKTHIISTIVDFVLRAIKCKCL